MQAELSRLRVVASDAPQPVELDESLDEGVPTPGGYIREQRMRRGLSIEQLAVATKIPASSLRLLENDDFGGLPGPVFVKGFLRCCTRALGVPSETVMELLYERERMALHARRQQQRPSFGDLDATPTAKPRLPPRVKVKERPAPDGGVVRSALAGLPRANTLLWLVVLAFIAMLVMAAFNLAGDSPLGPNT
jgi:cytoskeletal protein RodZ